ncbi:MULTISPECIES: LLM class oxidoreductase [unclassified Ruegeria]|uniref:LLM class oxidoreductase n=1 Tax=unclassified Ruegeria TaxID=2625375 RepID=UPI001490B514|nr:MULTISPECIES: LLM class oxidoreductase [unclassified Ruegeria]NOD89809.1 TIGR03571 family LLM class oxidoreductase [Ruegeria sp. HKCCD4318]NOE14745.1 TIGR03571 family LLM class oxidoreductase [Ruegeria sp. HKCCD4318-2]NOG10902.1 LLM class oxidoreductase [Ruegeria sp. HKCCD4315]
MLDEMQPTEFAQINLAYNRVFRPGRLSIGLVLPLESYAVGAEPTLRGHLEAAQKAEKLGFAALWLRDVPFNVPSFGDPGQVFDPFVYLGALATATDRIALGTSSVILPLRHPAHVAKAAATADELSGGRLLLGIASGDRPEEYPAMNQSYDDRGARFRDSVEYIRAVGSAYPKHENSQGTLSGGIDLLPKPQGARLPILITGGSQQTPDWVAQNGDGWMTYPRNAAAQGQVIADYRRRLQAAGQPDKPVMQSLYVNVVADRAAPPRPIHLGFQSGTDFLCEYLREIKTLGVNHVALNLRFNQAPIDATLDHLADVVLPHFS